MVVCIRHAAVSLPGCSDWQEIYLGTPITPFSSTRHLFTTHQDSPRGFHAPSHFYTHFSRFYFYCTYYCRPRALTHTPLTSLLYFTSLLALSLLALLSRQRRTRRLYDDYDGGCGVYFLVLFSPFLLSDATTTTTMRRRIGGWISKTRIWTYCRDLLCQVMEGEVGVGGTQNRIGWGIARGERGCLDGWMDGAFLLYVY